MAEKPTLNQLFEGLQRTLEAELGIARDTVDHSSTKGTLTEDRWIKVLRQHLPKRYEVNRAFVKDSRDACSDQIDVVVHDQQYSPFVLNLGGALYVPAESVYAVLEVKQTLNARHVSYSADKIASIRKLHRTSLPIQSASGELPAKPPHHILGGLLTLTSDWSPPFGDAFERAVAEATPDGRLDIGCAVRHGYFEMDWTNESDAIDVRYSNVPLADFLLRFIARLQSVATVPCIDVLAYAANIRCVDKVVTSANAPTCGR